MKFLRTASTRRLLSVIAGVVVAIAAGTAIAVASSGSGPVPKPEPLATAVHQALTGTSPTGITADISFTNNLIDSSDFTGQTVDPILQGATGRMWLTDGHLRLELQSDNGDAQVLVDQRQFWISDPTQHTVYEGTLPADSGRQDSGTSDHGVPSVADIQARLNKLMQNANAVNQATDVAGRAAYRAVVTPKHDGGLLGSAQLAWDAANGVPLEVGIYARDNKTPVLDLKATNISYGAVPSSDFAITPPAGFTVVKVSSPSHGATAAQAGRDARAAAKRSHVRGYAAVAGQVGFPLNAPASLVGLPRRGVTLLDMGGKKAALVTYGQNLGGMAVLEEPSSGSSSSSSSSSDSMSRDGLSLPSVSINGATGHELSTPLGTALTFSSGKVAYTVLGSTPAPAAEAAARTLTGP